MSKHMNPSPVKRSHTVKRLMSYVGRGYGLRFILVLVCIAGWIFAEPLVTCFRNDPDVIVFGAMALRLQCLTFWIQSFVVMSNMMDQVMGRTVPATFLAMARQGIFFIPAVLLLPVPLGALGVQLAQPVADVLSLASAIPIQKKVLASLPDEDAPEETEEVCASI